MNVKGLGHIILFGRFHKPDQSFGRCVLVVMATVTGIGLLVIASCFDSGLGKHESESMAVRISGFADLGYARHMAANTATKGMNAVYRTILYGRVAAFAQPVLKQTRLGKDGVQQGGRVSGRCQRGLGFVHIVAGDANHPHLGMFALLPIEILLVAVFGFSTGPEVVGILVMTVGFFEMEPKVTHSSDVLVFRRIGVFARGVPTPGVTCSADLGRLQRGQA
jgi:hypothetical protein